MRRTWFDRAMQEEFYTVWAFMTFVVCEFIVLFSAAEITLRIPGMPRWVWAVLGILALCVAVHFNNKRKRSL